MHKNSLVQQISSHAQAHPHKKAVIRPDSTGADYADFLRIYQEAAAFLEKLSVCGSHRFSIISGDGLHSALLTLPILEHAVLVPMDDQLTADQYEYFYKLLNVDYILTDSRENEACTVARTANLGVIFFRFSGSMGDLSCHFEVISPGPGSPSLQQSNGSCPPPAIIKTTSGTTSTPKIVPKSYENLVNEYMRIIKTYGLGEKDVHLVLTKMHQSHSFGDVLLTLMSGGTAILTNGFRHKEFIDVMNNNAVSWFVTAPAVLNSFSAYLAGQQIPWNTTALRFIRSSGAPLTVTTKEYYESIFRVPVVQTYGMSESGNLTSTWNAPKGFKEGSAGVSTGLEIRIENGEIQVKGDSLFGGYENPEISNETYFQDGWFRTGDEGHLDEDGYLFITGRIKEMINRGGEKVSPYEIENQILKNPCVKDAVVFPVANSYGSQDVAAAVVLGEASGLSLAELREFLSQKVASYKMPTCLYVVEEIPVGPNEKVQRRALSHQLGNLGCSPDYGDVSSLSNGAHTDTAGSKGSTEQILEEIWKKVLKKSSIGYDQDFFVLGGDSLSVSLVYAEIENQFHVQIPFNAFFEEKTIRCLAQYINTSKEFTKKYSYVIPIKATGNKPPLFCLHSGDGELGTYHELGSKMKEDRPVYGVRFNKDAAPWNYPLSFDQMAGEYAREIMEMLPDGPYYLCGTCYGGVLAYAVATRIAAAGRTVSMLAMLDSIYPGNDEKRNIFLHRIINSLDEVTSYSLPEACRLLSRKCRTAVQLVRNTKSISEYVKNQKNEAGRTNPPADLKAALSCAHTTFQPTHYDGKVYYFLATKDKVKSGDPIPYWAQRMQELEVVPMLCRHTEISGKGNSKFLAEKLNELMEC